MSGLQNPTKSDSAPKVFGRMVKFFICGGVIGGLIGGIAWMIFSSRDVEVYVFTGIGAFAGGAIFVAAKTVPLGAWALMIGIIGSGLCCLLVLAIGAVVILSILPGSRAGLWLFYIPIISIPAALLCGFGAILSHLALNKHSSSAAKIGLRLSLAGLAMAVLFSALGWCLVSFSPN